MLVRYYFNATTWMTKDIFTDQVMAKNNLMATKNKQILIMIDNASSHTVHGVPRTMIGVFEEFVLSNITLLLFPANMTSAVQPLDQGVIGALILQVQMEIGGLDFGTLCINNWYSRFRRNPIISTTVYGMGSCNTE